MVDELIHPSMGHGLMDAMTETKYCGVLGKYCGCGSLGAECRVRLLHPVPRAPPPSSHAASWSDKLRVQAWTHLRAAGMLGWLSHVCVSVCSRVV